MKIVDEKCGSCGSTVQVPKKEWVRQRKKNPTRVFYCDLRCSGKRPDNISHIIKVGEEPRLGAQKKAIKAAKKVNTKYSDFEKPFAEIMRRVRNRVRGKSKFKKDFDIDISYLITLWNHQCQKCSLTGISLSFTQKNKLLYPSLDRRDSSKGYCKGNVQFVCVAANLGKGAGTDRDFKEFVQKVSKNNR